MLDILTKNGNIIDGTGKSAFVGCVGVKNGKIMSANTDTEATRVIDAAGKVIRYNGAF